MVHHASATQKGLGVFYHRARVCLFWVGILCCLSLGRSGWCGSSTHADVGKANSLLQWCQELKQAIGGLRWQVEPCQGIDWKIGGTSVEGRPIVYAEFGNPSAENVTLAFSSVHGDEVTTVLLALRLAHWLQERPMELFKARVVLAPLVNPDGFYRQPRTRMNAHGVDVNRNFNTQDWQQRALLSWKTKYKSDPRRFPGVKPDSEPETQFQEKLIRMVQPSKIIAVHAPLNHIDFDGPSAMSFFKFPSEYTKACDQLRKKLKALSTGYFPGSLGNFAGRELGIPTVTLELPSADPKHAEVYWKRLRPGVQTMIQFTVPRYSGLHQGSQNASTQRTQGDISLQSEKGFGPSLKYPDFHAGVVHQSQEAL